MGKFRKELSTPEKSTIVASANKMLIKGTNKLQRGAMKQISLTFQKSERQIRRIRQQYHEQEDAGIKFPSCKRQKTECGRKTKLTPALMETIEKIAQDYASSCRYMSERALQADLRSLDYPLSLRTCGLYLTRLGCKVSKVWIKPLLTDKHKSDRMLWIINKADRAHGLNFNKFQSCFNRVHVDETWIYLKQTSSKIRLLTNSFLPVNPTCKHKSHIVKVMFLAALARPQRMPDGNWFDGKICMLPSVAKSPAKRTSKNRPAGTMETIPLSVDAAVYYEMMTKEGGVLDCIKSKMFWLKEEGIYIQHDGASPHNGRGNKEKLREAGLKDDWRIVFETQPAQSPDTNICDLSFFNSIQHRIHNLKQNATNIDQLIAKVGTAWKEYDCVTLDHIWGHLFACYNSILRDSGDNKYKAPHTKLRVNARGKETVVDLNIDVDAYNSAFQLVNISS
jgi:hypothetical protein